jgi:hypothetical protein
LFIISAAITPGTQPQQVSRNTNNTDPQPLSRMANGGKIMHKMTRKIDMSVMINYNSQRGLCLVKWRLFVFIPYFDSPLWGLGSEKLENNLFIPLPIPPANVNIIF